MSTSSIRGNEPKGVLIYGTGNVGQAVARIASTYGWPVSAVNRAGDKIGMDLGVLTGADALRGSVVGDSDGVKPATIWADVAVVAVNDRLEYNFPIHRQLLEMGLNVICVGAESSYPKDVCPKNADELDRIARDNGVTFTGCGLWDAYRIWSLRTLAGPCSELRSLTHRSITDANRFGADVANLAHIGEDPAMVEFDSGESRSIYRVFMVQVVEALGLSVADVDERQETVVLDEPVYSSVLERVVEVGKCAGIRTAIAVRTHEGVTASADIDLRLTGSNEGEGLKWIIDGAPPAEISISGIDSGHATASSVVHRIPDVLTAPPGLVTTDKMVPMTAPRAYGFSEPKFRTEAIS